MAIQQANIEHYTFSVDGMDEALLVFQYEAEESISQTFRCQLELASENSDIDFDSVVGKLGVLNIYDHDLQEVRYIHGMVNQFDQVGQKKRYTHYRLELVPQLCLLNYRRHCRIFQHKKVAEIIEEVLKSANLAPDYYQITLSGNYEERNYCVQYGETDLNFIQRLMEEEGMFYYFSHTKTSHTLRIADHLSVHKEITNPDIFYNESSNLVADRNYAYELCYSKAIQSGGVQLNDFNFEKPDLKLETNAKAENDAHLNIYDYPGVYDAPERGNNLAKVVLESHQARKIIVTGRSNCRQLVPGYLFSVCKHPRSDFNQKYMITAVKQAATQPQVLQEEVSDIKTTYESRFTCIPKDVTYRPPQRSIKPRIDGVQTAIVVGPTGEEIYTDEHGRVKVQFHWDLEGKNDDKSSCWIRVSQNWAGAGWGGVFIPRIGQEVIVDFVNGDPDRPLITGRVYHGTNLAPYKLPANKTQSGLKTHSTPGGGVNNFNELRFEDLKGSEQIYLHAEKNLDTMVENDETHTVDHNRTKTIGDNETSSIGKNRDKSVGENQSESIGKNKTISVGNNHTESIDKNKNLTVGENHTESIGKNMKLQVGVDLLEDIGKNLGIVAGDQIVLKTGSASITMKNNGDITIKGNNITLQGSGKMNVKASSTVSIKGSKVLDN